MPASFNKEQRAIAKESGLPLVRLQYDNGKGKRGVDVNGPAEDWVVKEIDALITKWLESKRKK